MAERKWVEERVNDVLLPALEKASTETEIQAVCEAEIAFWHTKAGTENSLRTPHTQSRKLVRESDLPEQKKAWVAQYLSLGKEKWTQVNRSSASNLATRLESQILLKDPDRIIIQAEALLRADRWQDLAAGLAVVTGRRSTEILKTAIFEPKTGYSVRFDGQLKNDVPAFEIPTLVEASKVMDAYKRLREALPVQNMSENDVSNSYHKALTASVRKHFEDIIPAHDGSSISTHTMRAIYLRLAIFLFCPVLVDADTYAAEISGHRSRADKEQRSYGAGAHYSHYKIADRNGNIDGRQGVFLGREGVEVLEVFASGQGRSIAVSAPNNGMVAPVRMDVLTPEALFTGELLQLVRDGMEAANSTDFLAYLTVALRRQARNDLGIARRDTVADVSEMSTEDLKGKRKHSTAVEHLRRAVLAIMEHNDSHGPMERWFINATVVNDLTGVRFQTVMDYLNEHKTEVDNHNNKHGLTKKYNRKPVEIKEVISVE